MANLSPTAANILSSLGIKGATVGENIAGCVPVLDANGKISVNLIPEGAAKLSVSSISNVVFVESTRESADRTSDAPEALSVFTYVFPRHVMPLHPIVLTAYPEQMSLKNRLEEVPNPERATAPPNVHSPTPIRNTCDGESLNTNDPPS